MCRGYASDCMCIWRLINSRLKNSGESRWGCLLERNKKQCCDLGCVLRAVWTTWHFNSWDEWGALELVLRNIVEKLLLDLGMQDSLASPG